MLKRMSKIFSDLLLDDKRRLSTGGGLLGAVNSAGALWLVRAGGPLLVPAASRIHVAGGIDSQLADSA
jgi:hypothetical protein